MTGTDTPPNQLCTRKRRLSIRRWVAGVIGLVLLGMAGWIVIGQRQFAARQAAAPVVRIAEDGTVSLYGRELIIGADGLPPKWLEELEGGPPVDKTDTAHWSAWVAKGPVQRMWRYPRSGLLLSVLRRVQNGAGTVQYQGFLGFGAPHGCTLEFRGQRWWLGPAGPLGGLRPEHVKAVAKAGEWDPASPERFSLAAGASRVQVYFVWFRPLHWLGSDWFKSPRYAIASVAIGAQVRAATGLKEKADAFTASGGKDIYAGW